MQIETILLIAVTSALVLLVVLFAITAVKIIGAIEREEKNRGTRHFLSSKESATQNEMTTDFLLDKISELKTVVLPNPRPEIELLADLANSYWHLEKVLAKENLFENNNNARSVKSYLKHIHGYLDKNQIEINDYEGKKYNTGLGIDVASFVEEEGVPTPYIKQVLSPEIRYNGAICRRANVIVARDSRKE